MAFMVGHRMAAKLLAASSLLAVCYVVLHLHNATGWAATSLFSDPPAKAAPACAPPATTAVVTAPPQAAAIPKKLWYKLGPAGLKAELRPHVDSCIFQNPGFEVEFVTDGSGDAFVREHFGAARPDLVARYLAVGVPIVKADLLRYLILYARGGVWNDLDVACAAPVREWVPPAHAARARLVVGLEFDVDVWVRQFATWTLLAAPRSPHLLAAVEDGLDYLEARARARGVRIEDLSLAMLDDVVDVSGPRRLTRGILGSLSRMLNETVDNPDIAHVSEPRLIGDVLVLPDYAFADSMNQQHGDKKVGKKLTVHHYAGSWKNAKGGEEASP